jgi:hypothetical protein
VPSVTPEPTPPTTAASGSTSGDTNGSNWLFAALLLISGATVAQFIQRRLDMRGNL